MSGCTISGAALEEFDCPRESFFGTREIEQHHGRDRAKVVSWFPSSCRSSSAGKESHDMSSLFNALSQLEHNEGEYLRSLQPNDEGEDPKKPQARTRNATLQEYDFTNVWTSMLDTLKIDECEAHSNSQVISVHQEADGDEMNIDFEERKKAQRKARRRKARERRAMNRTGRKTKALKKCQSSSASATGKISPSALLSSKKIKEQKKEERRQRKEERKERQKMKKRHREDMKKLRQSISHMTMS